MESVYKELALYGSKNLCARTDTVFLPISEVCDGTVYLGFNISLCFFSFNEGISKTSNNIFGSYAKFRQGLRKNQ